MASVCAGRLLVKNYSLGDFHEGLSHEPILVTESDRQEYINYREFNLHLDAPEFGAPIAGLPKKIDGLGPWCRHCGCLFMGDVND